MRWLFSHPYASSIAGVAFVLIVGMLIVLARSDVQPATSPSATWATLGADFTNPLGAAAPREGALQENLYTQVKSGAPFQYIPLPPPATETAAEDIAGLDGLLALLSRGKVGVDASGSTELEAYSFIPTGLISTSTPARPRTQVQSAIYEYGNEAGSYIQTYEERYQNPHLILKDQFEDRGDPVKNARLLDLAEAMMGVGESLKRIENIPGVMQSANSALAHSYIAMGTRLKAIAGEKTDAAMLEAIVPYNTSVEAFTKSYVSLVTLFSAHGVSFRFDEPGSVFMFTNAPVL